MKVAAIPFAERNHFICRVPSLREGLASGSIESRCSTLPRFLNRFNRADGSLQEITVGLIFFCKSTVVRGTNTSGMRFCIE